MKETKFKVGDRVEVKSRCSGCMPGETYTLKYEDNYEEKKENLWAVGSPKGSCGCHCQDNWELIKKGATMSLRTRIEALDDGWNKEGDDILQEMCENSRIGSEYVLYIPLIKTGMIRILRRGSPSNDVLRDINYSDQCSKLQAFKDALLWLLDKSGLEGHKKGDEIKIESEGKTYKVKILEEVE